MRYRTPARATWRHRCVIARGGPGTSPLVTRWARSCGGMHWRGGLRKPRKRWRGSCNCIPAFGFQISEASCRHFAGLTTVRDLWMACGRRGLPE